MDKPRNIFLKFEPVEQAQVAHGEVVMVFIRGEDYPYRLATYDAYYPGFHLEHGVKSSNLTHVARLNLAEPAPVPNDSPAVFDLMMDEYTRLHQGGDLSYRQETAGFLAYLKERKQQGIASYGVPLQAHNGRDAARDCLEEMVDGAGYAFQKAIEIGETDMGWAAIHRMALHVARIAWRKLNG